MAKQEFKSNPRVRQVFEDLEAYLTFCQDYGYKYDENDMYSNRRYVWRQFQKYETGKFVKNMWELDARQRG